MMGTLAGGLAAKKIPTPEDRYWAEVEGDSVIGCIQIQDNLVIEEMEGQG